MVNADKEKTEEQKKINMIGNAFAILLSLVILITSYILFVSKDDLLMDILTWAIIGFWVAFAGYLGYRCARAIYKKCLNNGGGKNGS